MRSVHTRNRGNAERLAYLRAELEAAWTGRSFDIDRAHRALQGLREELKKMAIKDSYARERKPPPRKHVRK